MTSAFAVIAFTAAVVTMAAPSSPATDTRAPDAIGADVNALLTAARGAPPLLCSMAARSVHNFYGWGDASDAPAPPLGTVVSESDRSLGRSPLPDSDIALLIDALSSDDACVREMAVRLVGRQPDERVTAPLLARLRSDDASVRSVAAMGLGLVDTDEAVAPLIATLRDESPAVRGN